MSTSLQELAEILQQLLMFDANQLGRSSGFIQRQRKLTGASFVQALVFGWQANPHASLEDLCQAACASGVTISPQGLQERLNARGAAFLKQVLERSLSYLVQAETGSIDFLKQFKGVYLQDSTTIPLPASLRNEWQGNGNQTGASAALKVQTVLDYQHGELRMQLVHARQHDGPLQTTDLPRGALRLADTGYFKVTAFQDLNQREVAWVARIPASVGVWHADHVVSLATWLAHQEQAVIDTPLELTAQRFVCRFIAVRVPEAVAQQRRERALADAKDRGKPLRPDTLALCDWTVIATNIPPHRLTVENALLLLRLRWQIELLFKLWKQTLALPHWHSARPAQILCELYAKLLIIVIQHWLLLLGCWDEPQRSLFKAVQVLRKHAFHLLTALPDPVALLAALTTILASLKRCLIQKRRTRPATFQLLARARP
jgi:hypothetical protein